MSIFIRTVPNVMRHFGCSAETAQRYIDLRDEGHGLYQAQLMAGLTDPPGDERSAAPTPAGTERHTRNEPDPESGISPGSSIPVERGMV